MAMPWASRVMETIMPRSHVWTRPRQGRAGGKYNHGDRFGLFRIPVGMVRKITALKTYHAPAEV